MKGRTRYFTFMSMIVFACLVFQALQSAQGTVFKKSSKSDDQEFASFRIQAPDMGSFQPQRQVSTVKIRAVQTIARYRFETRRVYMRI